MILLVEDRQRGRFAGFSMYVSNNGGIEGSNMCYKDETQLPPLNFTTTCTVYGRYVIFYNERIEGVRYPDGYQLSIAYTELCEVTVKGMFYVLYYWAFLLQSLLNCLFKRLLTYLSIYYE